MSFRLKTVLGIACIEALLLTILVISGLHYLSSSNAAQLQQRAATTAKLVATMTGDAAIAFDLATLDALVEQALRNPDLIYLRIRSANGASLSEGGDGQALADPFIEDQSIEQTSSDGRFDVQAPIMVAGTGFGHVELGLSTAALDATFSDALAWMVGIALSEMTLVALLGLALGHYLTRQLLLLKRGAKRVASGDFGYQIPISGQDELAETADSFNSMSKALARYADLAEQARLKAEAGRELAESTLQDALDSMRDSVLVIDGEGAVLLANQSYRALYATGEATPDVASVLAAEAGKNEGPAKDYVAHRLKQLAEPAAHPRWEAKLVDGRHLLIAQHPMSRGGVVIVQTDVSELYQALNENRQLHQELMQRQKTDALSTMAGGIAHEINTPVQVIADNATFVAGAVGEIIAMIDDLADADAVGKDTLPARLEAIDWAYLRDEIPEALADLANGTNQVRDLVVTFKQFAKPGETAFSPADITNVVKSAIEASRSDWQNCAEMTVDLPDQMPPVPCQIDQIKQVVQHLIVNAAHAIEDRRNKETGRVSVRLTHDHEHAVLEIGDNGCGIAPEHLDRIYDVLFSTKEPGRGAGQGLALANMIVTRGHGGRIAVESTLSAGTSFTVMLPFEQKQYHDPAAPGGGSQSADDRPKAVVSA